ncbi:MAG TPA: glycosyltransferase family 1 protein [Anaeromyxobacteraceae bacterium]|nr:glycosyltransferase family 1 protein [Anaeromyxobacteraceae bacterium]
MTGAGRYIVELAVRLPALAEHLALDVLLLPAMKTTPVPRMIADAGARIHYVDTRIATIRQWVVIPYVLERLRPDLYHYPFLDMPYSRFPSLVTIYDLNPILHPHYFRRLANIKRPVARRMIGSTLRRSRAVITISDATRHRVAECYPESADKLRTIRLGVDALAWAGDAQGHGGAGAGGGDWTTRSYVLYVGVDRPHKNLVRLVRAFGNFRATNGSSPGNGPYLWLAGVGTGSPALRGEVSSLSLSQDVRFDPELNEAELHAAYRGARAFAYLSTSEGFGLPVLEALAAGVPVVAANTSSLPEVGGDAVLYASPHDESAISDALNRIWSDESLRDNLVGRGRHRVLDFSWDTMASATLEAYYDAASPRIRGKTDDGKTDDRKAGRVAKGRRG